MSIKVMAWAWEQATTSSGEKLVLLALADHANDDGQCWPGMERIGQKCGMGKRQVSNHVQRLIEAGLLGTTRRCRDDHKYSTYLYQLNLSSSGNGVPLGQEKPSSAGPAEVEFRTEPSVKNRKKEPSLSSSSVDDGFAEFWKIYPRKVGKGAALKAFRKHRKKTALDLILNACSLYAIERKGKDVEYTAHPATWLNQERWHDDQDPAHNPDHQEPEIEIPRWEPCGDCNNGWITEYDDKGYEYARPCICRP
jgi:hypothetical protein